MEQAERRIYLLKALLGRAAGALRGHDDPSGALRQRRLLRALLNVRPPESRVRRFPPRAGRIPAGGACPQGRDGRGSAAPDAREGFCCGAGTSPRLRCDAIVNAANSALLGCFCPNHGCIDNAIHTFAGVQLRLYCAQVMKRQGGEEAAGGAKLTPAFNLPSRYVLHTVGPMVNGWVTSRTAKRWPRATAPALTLRTRRDCAASRFCCISTGEFGFPNEPAAEIAVGAVRVHKAVREKRIRVIFNVFKERDENIYRRLLASGLNSCKKRWNRRTRW